MRVIYLVSLFPCWSETFIVREIHALRRQGVDVRIVSLKHPSEKLVQSDAAALQSLVLYPPGFAASAWTVFATVLRHPLRELATLRALMRGLSGMREALLKSLVVWWRTLALAPAVRALAPDHLHAHWATYPSTAAWMLSSRIGVPFSFTSHAHDIFLEDHLLAQKFSAAAFGVTISAFNRRYLTARVAGLDPTRIRIVHCGVVLSDFPYQPEGRAPRQLLAVGRLDEIKGFSVLIDACAVLAQRGIDFQCEIIGEGPLRAALEAQIAQHGLGDRVRLPGVRKQEEVRSALLGATVFVLPSVVTSRGDRDGIPVALMEAMAVGTPVVSTRVSGIPELVEHDLTGLLADEHDAVGLADALQRLLTEPALGGRLAQAARARIEAEFEIDAQAQRLLAAITEARHGR